MDQGENSEQPIASHDHTIAEWKIEHQIKSVGDDTGRPFPPHAHQLVYKKFDNITVSDVFTNYYIPSHYFDIENLKVYLFSFYNAYVSSYPTIAIPEFCTKAGLAGFYKSLSIRNYTRGVISEEQYSSQYDNLFWLKAYFLIRLREVGVSLSRNKKSKALEKIGHAYNSLDFMGAMNYIQIYLKQYY